MGENITCTCSGSCIHYITSSCTSKHEWCHLLRPPPFPSGLSPSQELINMFNNDPGIQLYKGECPGYIDLPRIDTTKQGTLSSSLPITTESITKSSFNMSHPPINISTTTTAQQETNVTAVTRTTTAVTSLTSILTTTPAATAGGTIAGIIILVLFIIIALIVGMLFLWKRQKKRTGSINSLPMEKYENTNYLDNKARANHSWSPSQNQLTADPACKGTSYGSLPPPNGAPQYVKAENRTSDEVRVESPRDFDKMNSSATSEKLAFDNENFDKNGEVSPGASSQTPLFDSTDGSALPNVPSNMTTSIHSVNQTDKKPENGVKLPPIDMSKSSITDLRSPKKKKPIYLQRTSCPVEGIEDISHDMTGNRKSV